MKQINLENWREEKAMFSSQILIKDEERYKTLFDEKIFSEVEVERLLEQVIDAIYDDLCEYIKVNGGDYLTIIELKQKLGLPVGDIYVKKPSTGDLPIKEKE